MASKYKTVIGTPDGPRTCFQVVIVRDRGRKPLVARFGGIPLRRQRTAVLTDQSPIMASAKRNELIHRLLAERCELCESTDRLEVHHLRKLADLNRHDRPDKPAWVPSWRNGAARPWSSAGPATRTSTPVGHAHPPGIEHWRAVCQGNRQARFGKRPTEKDPHHGHLAGGPLHSASDLGKRTGSNPGTAPQVDSTTAHRRETPADPAAAVSTPRHRNHRPPSRAEPLHALPVV